MKTYDYLNGTQIYLHQKKGMFRINTDTTLLGQFYVLNKGEKILDIGTNNGALLLYKKGIEAKFYGIDILEQAIELASENFKMNDMEVSLECVALQNYTQREFDVVICNPPYFSDSLLNESNIKHQRHDISLSLDELFSNVKRIIKSNGRFYLVHRASMINDIYASAIKYGFRPKQLKFLFDQNKDSARSIVLEFTISNKCECKVLKSDTLCR